jgi:hypothetical protein
MLPSLLKKKFYALLMFYYSKAIQERKRVYIWSIYKNRCKIYLGVKPPSESKDQIFITVIQSRVSWYGAPPLTKGWVCHLQLLLALSSPAILRSKSRGTHDHILLSEIGDSSNLEGQIYLFISPRNRVAQIYPQALG